MLPLTVIIIVDRKNRTARSAWCCCVPWKVLWFDLPYRKLAENPPTYRFMATLTFASVLAVLAKYVCVCRSTENGTWYRARKRYLSSPVSSSSGLFRLVELVSVPIRTYRQMAEKPPAYYTVTVFWIIREVLRTLVVEFSFKKTLWYVLQPIIGNKGVSLVRKFTSLITAPLQAELFLPYAASKATWGAKHRLTK